MSLIPCTSSCVYQQDGTCTLERAASCGTLDARPTAGCVHFISAGSKTNCRESIPNGLDHGQL